MSGKRFAFIAGVLAVVALIGPASQWAGQRGSQPIQQPPSQIPAPRFPADGDPGGIRGPAGSIEDEPLPKLDPRQQLKESQKKLTADVAQLLQLATELKDESDKTKETDVLSLPLIHKAEEIEKLAKQIKDLARAN